MGSLTPIPYWQANLPPTAPLPVECPPFLQNLSGKDITILATPDADYTTVTWPMAREIVATNKLGDFQRLPSQLRKYIEYNYNLRKQHGSVMNFVLKERLGWELPIVAKGEPFEEASDLKILWNDWPYGLDERIVHLVVWVKFPLPDDPTTDDLTHEARAMIDSYVEKTFRQELGAANVIWFKNFMSIKSVRSLEHFHVMLFDPAPEFVDGVTGGDVPLFRKV